MKALLDQLTIERLSKMANSGMACHTINDYHITLANNGLLAVYDASHSLVFSIRLNYPLLKRKNACA